MQLKANFALPKCIGLPLFLFYFSPVKGLCVFEKVVSSTPSHLTLAVKMINKNVFRFTENVVWTSETFFINDGHRLIKINIFSDRRQQREQAYASSEGRLCLPMSAGRVKEKKRHLSQAERNGSHLLKRHCSIHAFLFSRFRGVVPGFTIQIDFFFLTFQLKWRNYHQFFPFLQIPYST